MAHVVKDRVQETSTTTGTGSFTLDGAVSGFQTFSSAIGNTNTTYYTIQNGAEWEVGIGTVGAGTLSRDTILESSNSGSAVNFSAGTKQVFCTYPAEKSVDLDTAQTLTNKTISGSSNTLSNIGNSSLTNSSITINGTPVSLGGSASVGTVTSVGVTAGTGISVSGSPVTGSGSITVTNTAPDQTVSLTAGSNISITGTYPSFTIASTAGGSGDVVGPSSATDNAIARYDGTTGKLIQDSAVTINDTTGSMTFTGSSARIIGAMTNAGSTDLKFQTSVANSPTYLQVIPNGTSGRAGLFLTGQLNTARIAYETQLELTTPGTQDIVFTTNNTSERLRILQNGAIAFNGSTNYGTSGQLLQSAGNAPPTWVNQASITAGAATSAQNLQGGSAGVIPYQSANSTTLFTSAGTSGQVLLSGGTSAPTWGAVSVAAGGTGQTSYTNGQLLIGNTTGNTLTKATLTAGTGISITNGAGSITIAATGAAANVQTFNASGTWNKPSSGTMALIRVWGAGGSGGRGGGTAPKAAGGGGGGYVEELVALSSLASTGTVTVGAGGTAVSSSGNGNAGGNSTFVSSGVTVTAYGGGGGLGNTANAYGGGGGGALSAGSGTLGAAGSPDGGAGGITSTAGGNGIFWGGGGGAGTDATTAVGGSAVYGGAGGGGANSGSSIVSGAGTSLYGGNGGAGTRTAGASGGTGVQPGGGGGGQGNTSGSSGAGGAGRVEVIVW